MIEGDFKGLQMIKEEIMSIFSSFSLFFDI